MLTDGRTKDEVITIAHPEQSSGELKSTYIFFFFLGLLENLSYDFSPSEKKCISNFIYILCLPLNVGLSYCIFTYIFV